MKSDEMTDSTLRKYYMDCFGTKSGQIVLLDLANRCYKHDTTLAGNAEQTNANEGRRQSLLFIESMIDPSNFTREDSDLENKQ